MTNDKCLSKKITLIVLSIAVLVLSSVFAISYSKWQSDGAASVTMNGSIGLYYVEFSAADVTEDTDEGYYIVGSMNGWTTTAEYKMLPNVTDGKADREVMLANVALAAGTQLQIARRTTETVTYIANWKDMATYDADYSSDDFEYIPNGNMTVNKSGLFDFYYSFAGNDIGIWVEYAGEASYIPDSSQPLRSVSANCSDCVYNTYVCVSRTSDETSIAYLDFGFSAEDEYQDVSVTSISITRQATEGGGADRHFFADYS